MPQRFVPTGPRLLPTVPPGVAPRVSRGEPGPAVGAMAPDVTLPGVPSRTARGEPRVLAFAPAWSIERERPEALQAIRAQLRGLGAELLVLSQGTAWSVRADDPVERLGPASAGGARTAEAPDPIAAGIAATAARYGVAEGRDAVFVIDNRGLVRFTHRPAQPLQPVGAKLAEALAIAGEALHARDPYGNKDRVLFTRREWSVTCLVVGFATAYLSGCKEQAHKPAERRPDPAAAGIPATIDITLTINGKSRKLTVDPRASLLDTLRETLALTGTKKGCDAGQCGACTVLLGGKRITSCLTLAVMAQGKDVTTIEGLAQSGTLHPMQQAFVEHDGLQCGFCTPGQILSAVAMLGEGHATTDAEVREQMSGNLCRCGAYPNIVAAIQAARRVRG